MTPALLPLGAALAYNGMAALCLATERQYGQWRGRGASPTPALRRGLRLAAALALSLAAVACIADAGAAVGIILWLGELSAAALLVAGLWTYATRAALPLGAVALAAALLC
ncbi:DUF3325 family protein [Rugamonas sp.]|uniref:DUF3325 family protein n=1 Tax=Rugamonas sp. TaxID=1926287 RepID=UPI0025D9FF79|nr:DUF3325 family protein [Rugamonas sp.]